MKKLSYILLFLSLYSLNAQPPSKWFNKFGGAGIDIGYGVKETFEKKYIVVGSTSSFGSSVDAYLVLVDSMGQKIWQKTIGGALTDVAKSVVVNPVDSGFIFVGYTNSIGFGGYDVYVVRTDKNGNAIWQRSYGGLDWDFGSDIILAPDGNIIICGYTFSMGYGKKDGYVAKVNVNSGALIWQKYYGGQMDDVLNSVINTSDGLLSFCGTKTSDGIDNDFWLLKLSLNGDSIISKSVTTFTSNERCYDFIEDKSNKLIFCGALDTTAAMTEKYASYALKTDLNGTFISETTFTNGATPTERFHSICNSKNGNIISLSRKINQNVFKLNCYILQAFDDFSYIASPTYGDFEDDELFNIESCSDNGYILCGYTKSYGASSEDIFVVKLDSNVLNAQSVIGLKENTRVSHSNRFYYHKNKLYFDDIPAYVSMISVFDINGKLVLEGVSKDGSFEIKPQCSGVYFATLKQGDQIEKLKFIVAPNHE